ncbi:MAG: endonuclease/exonuclease/phosphatase family protein [Nannocystaceae bacterium]
MVHHPIPRLFGLTALLALGCSEPPRERDALGVGRSNSGSTLEIATWNMEWLHRNNGAGEVPRDDADYQRMGDYADLLDADIIALQEVDGPEAAARVFDPAIYDFHMSSRNSVQRTGFAYRKDLDVTELPDYTALGIGGLRRGTDLEVEVDGQVLRLLAVHLKSGCFTRRLSTSSGSSSCRTLARQVELLEDWIDARAAEGVAFMVLGDFNRRMFASNGDDMWEALDDGSPVGADLSSPTESGTALCNNSRFPQFIDHLVMGSLAAETFVPGSFEQVLYEPADSGFALPDHCPLSVEVLLGAGGSTCEGSCGGQSPDGCWCDDACVSFGNCCADKVAVCDPPLPDPNSCEGHCGAQAPGGCWCNDSCVSYGDCCDDEIAQCG